MQGSLLAQAPGGWAGTLAPGVALLLTGLALVFGWALYRLSDLEVLAPFRPYILILLLGAWGFAAVEAVFALAFALTSSWVAVGLFLLAVLTVTNLSWMRHVAAGLVLALEGRLDVGDTIEIGEIDGEIEAFGLRAVRVQGSDGRLYDVPNRRLVDETLADLAEAGDSMCELVVSVPDPLTIDRARTIARRSAALTPYASPRHCPEVLVETGGGDEVRLKVRGYAYQSSRRDSYRSDVTERILEAFEADRRSGADR
ncbi:MAG: mechanosensitive ion channel domain-containing protein [Bradymonadaceae bacterium]